MHHIALNVLFFFERKTEKEEKSLKYARSRVTNKWSTPNIFNQSLFFQQYTYPDGNGARLWRCDESCRVEPGDVIHMNIVAIALMSPGKNDLARLFRNRR